MGRGSYLGGHSLAPGQRTSWEPPGGWVSGPTDVGLAVSAVEHKRMLVFLEVRNIERKRKKARSSDSQVKCDKQLAELEAELNVLSNLDLTRMHVVLEAARLIKLMESTERKRKWMRGQNRVECDKELTALRAELDELGKAAAIAKERAQLVHLISLIERRRKQTRSPKRRAEFDKLLAEKKAKLRKIKRAP